MGATNTKGISDKPIRLKIYSPHVVTMTLVDLPGLTRVPVGDQPPDIEARLRRLILDYVSSPSCIILAVSPANQDLASSDALDIARQADPEGTRTIGVLTKLDIMDRGTDAAAVLRNEVVPLQLGYVGVVLRSQEDIAQRRSMGESRERERCFFQSRSEYGGSVAGNCGVTVLARVLNGILVDHIRDALPTLRARLEDAATLRRRELRLLGDAPPGSSGAARGALLLSILDNYAARFGAMLDGHGDHLPITELAGGARIRHIFLDIFSSGLDALDPTAELSDEDVRTAIKNSGGIKGTLLIPEAPFELLVRRAIERLLAPSLQCKDFVHAELLRMAAQCVPLEVGRFPALQTVLGEAVEELVNGGASPADQMIKNLVSCELAYINTSHPQFVGGNRAIAEVLNRRSHQESSGGDVEGGGGRDVHGLPAHRPRSAPKAHPVTTSSSPNGLAAATKIAVRGLQPELFRPEVLLSAKEKHQGVGAAAAPITTTTTTTPSTTTTHMPSSNSNPASAAAEQQQQEDEEDGARGWFSKWFARGGGNAPGDATTDCRGDAGMNSPAGAMLLRPPPTLKVPKAASDQEGVQVEVTRVLVDSYFDIVRKNLQDAVPKAVMHFLVGATRRSLQQHLIRSLYREDLLGELMAEREDVAVRRHQCQESLRAVRAAMKTLEALPGESLRLVNGVTGVGSSSARWNFKTTTTTSAAVAVGATAVAVGEDVGLGVVSAAGGGGGDAQQYSYDRKTTKGSSNPLKNGLLREKLSLKPKGGQRGEQGVAVYDVK